MYSNMITDEDEEQEYLSSYTVDYELSHQNEDQCMFVENGETQQVKIDLSNIFFLVGKSYPTQTPVFLLCYHIYVTCHSKLKFKKFFAF